MYRELLFFVLIQLTAASVKVCLKFERNKEGIFSDYKICEPGKLACEVFVLELPKGQRSPGDVWVPWGQCRTVRCDGKPLDDLGNNVYYHCCEEDKCNIVPHQFYYQPQTPRFFPDSATETRPELVVLVLCLNVAIKLFL